MSDQNWTIYTSAGVRTMDVGLNVRAKRPKDTIELDSGDFRPNFLLDVFYTWSERNPGSDLRIKVTATRIKRGKDDMENFVKEHGWDGALIWPNMSADRVMRIRIWIDGVEQPWGSFWDVAGINFLPGNKAFKRAQEFVRLSRIWLRENLTVKIITNDELAEMGLRPHNVDGISIVKMSLALRSADNIWNPEDRIKIKKLVQQGRIVRMNAFRYMYGAGTIKGDGFIVPDDIFEARWGDGVEIVTSEENLKAEVEMRFGFEGFLTWDPKKPLGPVLEDFQTRAWMKTFTSSLQESKETISAILKADKEAIETGDIPDWLQFEAEHYLQPKRRFDPWGDERPPHESEALIKNFLRLSGSGLDLRGSATMTSLIIQGRVKKVAHRCGNYRAPNGRLPEVISPEGFTPASISFWAPIPWALRGYVITDVMVALAGYDIENTDAIYYDKRVQSLVVPSDLWERFIPEHGGGDLDDALNVLLRRVPDEGDLTNLRYFIPDLRHGETIAIVYRQPNSNGEYFAMRVKADEMPWFNEVIDIPVLNMDDAPVAKSLRPKVTDAKVPVDTFWPNAGDTYLLEHAIEAVQVAHLNVGVGPLINSIMKMDDMGLDPQLPFDVEWAIDTCQAQPFREAMVHIKNTVTQMEERIRNSDKKMDLLLAMNKLQRIDDPSEFRKDGYFYKVWVHNIVTLTEFEKDTRALGFQLRRRYRYKIAEQVTYDPTAVSFAKNLLEKYLKQQRALVLKAEKIKREKSNEESPYQAASGRFAQGIIQQAQRRGKDREWVYQVCLALYREMLQSRGDDQPHGVGDNLIFGPPPANRIGMLDLFLETMAYLGRAKNLRMLRVGAFADMALFDRLGPVTADTDEEWFTQHTLETDPETGKPIPKIDDLPIKDPRHKWILTITEESHQAMEEILQGYVQANNDAESHEALRIMALRGEI